MTTQTIRQVIKKVACNRCGKKDEYPTFINDVEIIEETSKVFRQHARLRLLIPTFDDPNKDIIYDYDLCDECYDEFQYFMDGRTTSGTEQSSD